ncbi:MAG: M56 family metallopeptidase [Planctomycetota bacterium]
MTELLESNVAVTFVRITLLLLIGLALVRALRFAAPSLAIAVTRCLFIALWLGPIVVLTGWSVPIAMLPPDAQLTTPFTDDGAPSPREPTKLLSVPSIPAGPSIGAPVVAISPKTTPGGVPEVPAQAFADESRVTEFDSELARPPASTPSPMLWTLAVVIWAIVSIALLVRLFVSVLRTRSVISGSEPCCERLQLTLDRVAQQLHIQHPSVLRISHAVAGPCTVGIFKHVILLPASWASSNERLSEAQLEMIFAHELTHAAGRDTRWDALGRVTAAIWWFHPCVAALVRAHRLACEHRCDAAASRISGNVDFYRQQLARWAIAILDSDATLKSDPLASLAMAARPLLLRRLSWLKRGRVTESTTPSRRFAMGIVTAVLALACLAIQPIRRSLAATQPPTESKNSDDTTNNGSPAAPAKRITATESAEPHLLVPSSDSMGYFGDERPTLNWDERVNVSVTVTDQDTKPVANAIVQLTEITDLDGRRGMFSIEFGASTNDRGAAVLRLPGGTRRYRLRVTSAGYAALSTENYKLADRVEITLQSGRIERIRAVDKDGNPLPNAFPLVEQSSIYGREFKAQGGVHVSPVLAPERRAMWVVDGSDSNRPILFSDLIDLEDQSGVDASGVRQVTLQIGTRLVGKLGHEVPRPIKNGFVHVAILENGKQRTGPRLAWHQYTKIQEDGSFVFESLPRNSHAQLFAICEGWQSKNPSKESIRQYFQDHNAGTEERIDSTMDRYNANPQLYRLAPDQKVVQIEIPCRQSTSLDVRVVDPIGNPIAGATVTTSPNLAFFGDLVIPGVQFWTDKMIRGDGALVYNPNDPFSRFASAAFLEVMTDSDGIARLRNLPNTSESFEVVADGYVMSAYPGTDARSPGRYGLTGEMTPGKVTRCTVTMERDLKRTERELLVVDQNGQPLKDVELTITAIATGAQDPNWQQWSVRRFGEASRKQTNPDGLAKLLHPQIVDGSPVTQLTVRLEGRITEHRWLNKTLVVPAQADGYGFRVTATEPTEQENARGRWKAATVEYTDIFTDAASSPATVLRELVERSDLLSLRKLLAANEFDAFEPVKMLAECNRTELRNRSATELVRTTSGDRIVALASVRPSNRPTQDTALLKEVAFIFDDVGTLAGVIGGGSKDREDLVFTNLGGTFNFFVRVSGFEQHGRYEYASRWYKVDEPDKPALTVFHQANSASFAAFQGSKFPRAEYGFLGFGLNGVRLDSDAEGTNRKGAIVPRTIVWDRRKGKFFGELSQSRNGRAIYRVVPEESSRFQPITATKQQITIVGGRRDFQNWHLWKVAIPEDRSMTATLELRDESGKKVRSIHQATLAPGLHKLQLLFEDAPDSENSAPKTSTLVLLVDAKDANTDRLLFKIPHLQITEAPTIAGRGNYIVDTSPLEFIEKPTTNGNQRLVWTIE